MRRWAATFLVFSLAYGAWQEGFSQVSSVPVLVPSQPSRPMSPGDRLADPNRSARAKIEAAQALLADGGQ